MVNFYGIKPVLMRKLLLLTVFIYATALCQEVNPGVDRWKIKTSIVKGDPKRVDIADLINLENPTVADTKPFETTRMSDPISSNGLKEGDIVVTEGYLHLVALEDDSKNHKDGDYHIQVTDNAGSGDNCLIVEIPYPDFISDSTLKANCSLARTFVREELLRGNEPSKTGSVMQHEVYVKITGQLFADLSHLKNNHRGKKGMKSPTIWEIHPVYSIAFAPKPKK